MKMNALINEDMFYTKKISGRSLGGDNSHRPLIGTRGNFAQASLKEILHFKQSSN